MAYLDKRCNASLCQQCRHNNWEYLNELNAINRQLKRPQYNFVWCDASDRPEDEQWDDCPSFAKL